MIHFNYDKPMPGPGAPSLSGVPATTPLNRGWGWNWTGRERLTGRVREYYTRTSFGSKADLREAMAFHFPGIEFIDGGPADHEPKQVYVMPPYAFMQGPLIRDWLEERAMRTIGVPIRSVMRTLPRRVFARPSL